ncbi:hypothetical protein WA158_006153 [Blastocystis sp. Blastoise]
MSQNDKLFEGIFIQNEVNIILDVIHLRKCYYPSQSVNTSQFLTDNQDIILVSDEIETQVKNIISNMLSKVSVNYQCCPLQTNYMNIMLEETINKIIFAHTGKILDKSVTKNAKLYCDKLCEYVSASTRAHYSNWFEIERKNGKNHFISKRLCPKRCLYCDFHSINSVIKAYLSDKRKNGNLQKLLGFKEIKEDDLLNNVSISEKPFLKEFEWKINDKKIAIMKMKDKRDMEHIYTLDDELFKENDLSREFAHHMIIFMKNPKNIFPFFDTNVTEQNGTNGCIDVDIEQVESDTPSINDQTNKDIVNPDDNVLLNDISLDSDINKVVDPKSKNEQRKSKRSVTKKKRNNNRCV